MLTKDGSLRKFKMSIVGTKIRLGGQILPLVIACHGTTERPIVFAEVALVNSDREKHSALCYPAQRDLETHIFDLNLTSDQNFHSPSTTLYTSTS